MFSNLNNLRFLQVLRAKTPEDLATLIASVGKPVKIMGFGQDSKGAFAYVNPGEYKINFIKGKKDG